MNRIAMLMMLLLAYPIWMWSIAQGDFWAILPSILVSSAIALPAGIFLEKIQRSRLNYTVAKTKKVFWILLTSIIVIIITHGALFFIFGFAPTGGTYGFDQPLPTGRVAQLISNISLVLGWIMLSLMLVGMSEKYEKGMTFTRSVIINCVSTFTVNMIGVYGYLIILFLVGLMGFIFNWGVGG